MGGVGSEDRHRVAAYFGSSVVKTLLGPEAGRSSYSPKTIATVAVASCVRRTIGRGLFPAIGHR